MASKLISVKENITMQTRDIEQDLVDYIMGLWDQQHRFKLIQQGRKKMPMKPLPKKESAQ